MYCRRVSQKERRSVQPQQKKGISQTEFYTLALLRAQEKGRPRHYDLPAMLPPSQRLCLVRNEEGIGPNLLAILAFAETRSRDKSGQQKRETKPLLLTGQFFSEKEIAAIQLLLELYPNGAPYEVMLAQFHQRISADGIKFYRKKLQEAASQSHGDTFDETMRPLRNLVSRARLQLEHLNFTIGSIQKSQYQLQPKLQRLKLYTATIAEEDDN